MKEELKPCPFCGEKPWYELKHGDGSRTNEWHIVECPNVNCLEVITHMPTKEEAYEAWNTREGI
jgi:hypothetical protein